MALSVRSILVTGASRGLGLEFVKQLVALQSAPEVVIAACRDPTSATNLQEIAKLHPSVKVIKLDVEKDEDIESAFKVILVLFERLIFVFFKLNWTIFDMKARLEKIVASDNSMENWL